MTCNLCPKKLHGLKKKMKANFIKELKIVLYHAIPEALTFNIVSGNCRRLYPSHAGCQAAAFAASASVPGTPERPSAAAWTSDRQT